MAARINSESMQTAELPRGRGPMTPILFFGPNQRSSPSPTTFWPDVCGEDADPLSNKLILTIACGRLPVLT